MGDVLSTLEAIILGVVQGLTEFLPVSSSGHLVIGGYLLGLEKPSLLFDVVVHVATLVATCVFYRQFIKTMWTETYEGLRLVLTGNGWENTLGKLPAFRCGLLVIAGSIPTAFIGLTFKDPLQKLFSAPKFAAGMLLVTALILLATRFKPGGQLGLGHLSLQIAVVIGIAQGLAIVPGISRSGTTIACALFLGVQREHAARFSFLLAIPAIVGALLLELGELGSLATVNWRVMTIGFVASVLTGLGALRLLIPLINRGAFHYFALYLVPVGILGLIFIR